jgi:hypothetical protein
LDRQNPKEYLKIQIRLLEEILGDYPDLEIEFDGRILLVDNYRFYLEELGEKIAEELKDA